MHYSISGEGADEGVSVLRELTKTDKEEGENENEQEERPQRRGGRRGNRQNLKRDEE